jgi:hypothetical protein
MNAARPTSAKWIRDFFRSRLHHWQKGEDFLVRKFLGQVKDDPKGRFFGEPLLQRMEETSKRLSSIWARLTLVNLALYIILLASVFKVALQVNLLGLDLGPASVAREVVLVISANLGLVAGAIYIHAGILRRLAVSARVAATPEPFSLAHMDRLGTGEIIGEAMQAYSDDARFGSRPRRILTPLFQLLLVGTILVQLLLYLAVATVIHVAVMIDIWHNPSLPPGWSHAIVVYSAMLDVLSLTSGLFMYCVPLRYRNSEIFSEYMSRSRRSETEAALYIDNLVKADRRKGTQK